MLASDPLVLKHFPQYLPSEDEIAATAALLDLRPALKEAFEAYVCIGGDSTASLRRFCWQAKQNNLKGSACAEFALKLLEKCTAHRLNIKLNTVLEAPTFSSEYWRSFMNIVPQTYLGVGKRGQPIVLVRLGQINPAAMDRLLKDGESYAAGGVNAAILAFLRCEEFLLRRQVNVESARRGHLTDRIILVLDLWGLGMSHWRVMKDFLLAAIHQTVLLYPETLDKLLVVNAAWAMSSMIWPVFKQFIHPVTQVKVKILDSGSSKAGMLQEVDDSVLPAFLGGPNEGIHLGQLLEKARSLRARTIRQLCSFPQSFGARGSRPRLLQRTNGFRNAARAAPGSASERVAT